MIAPKLEMTQYTKLNQIKQLVNKYRQQTLYYSAGLAALALVASLVYLSQVLYLPKTYVAGIDISYSTQPMAQQKLTQASSDYLNQQLVFSIQPDASSSLTPVPVSHLVESYDIDQTLTNLLQQQSQSPITYRLQRFSQGGGLNQKLITQLNQVRLERLIQSIEDELNQNGVPARISSTELGWQIEDGKNGLEVDTQKLRQELTSKLELLDPSPVEVDLKEIIYQIDPNERDKVLTRAERLAGLNLKLIASDSGQTVFDQEVEGSELVNWINPLGGFHQELVRDYFESINQTVKRQPQNATFEFDGEKVVEFTPSQTGLSFTDQTPEQILDALNRLEQTNQDQTLVLELKIEQPEITTAQVNDLGIRQLLGRGESTFRGSIPSRVHNVALTASKLHGTLVPPGEVFSFNQTVGEINREAGFQSAYIIQNGRTVLGDGGGVCQDSTTLFRAILDAGLPLVDWKAHSYRVGYYEQNEKPGFDATIYSPTVDLSFRNDTNHHLLIQTEVDTTNMTLAIEIYGTDDGRQAIISDYSQWGATPPPEPLYQDDPSLPAGTIKQIDWAAPGLRVSYDYTVVRDGETLYEKTFQANYKAWQAVYLRGVGQ